MASSAIYRVPVARSDAELKEKGSRFLAIVEPCRDRDGVVDRIRVYQQKFQQATHVCWAWRIGEPAKEGRSDAGEPAGTAGMPMLQVLRGAELSDVLAVVVRWFGGVKLGKGGLARAYAGAVQEALARLPVGQRRSVAHVRIRLTYDRFGDFKRLLRPSSIEIVEEVYGDQIDLLLEVDSQRLEELMQELGNCALTVEIAGN